MQNIHRIYSEIMRQYGEMISGDWKGNKLCESNILQEQTFFRLWHFASKLSESIIDIR